LTFTYPDAGSPALHDVSIEIEDGELVAVFGTSGSGKSTFLRALSGLVPHFHGGRFEGRVEVAGSDTRTVRPAELTGTVATVFQDPEEQIVLTHVAREVAFGLENLGTPPNEILPRAHQALATVGALELVERPVSELSGSALPWPRRLRCDRGCCCWTNPPRSSTPLLQSRSWNSSPSWVSPW
jgi:energy-coupling factor transport system ATP-binding protein